VARPKLWRAIDRNREVRPERVAQGERDDGHAEQRRDEDEQPAHDVQDQAHFHLRDPIPVQYVFYMQGLLTGDWGFTTSAIKGGMPVTQAVSIFFPQTVELAIAATAFATLVGIPTGTVSALRKDKLPDHATRIFALIGYSIPFFWLALLLQILAISLVPGWEITGGYSPSSISPSTEPWAFVDLGGTYQLF